MDTPRQVAEKLVTGISEGRFERSEAYAEDCVVEVPYATAGAAPRIEGGAAIREHFAHADAVPFRLRPAISSCTRPRTRSWSCRVGLRGHTWSSVRTELQADCFAGMWVKNAAATGFLEPPTEAQICADALRTPHTHTHTHTHPPHAARRRRRPDPAEDPGPDHARDVDPRVRGPAADLVHERFPGRHREGLRHLQRPALRRPTRVSAAVAVWRRHPRYPRTSNERRGGRG